MFTWSANPAYPPWSVPGTAGAIGGMLLAKYAGWVLDRIGSFTPIFALAASAYVLALLVIHILSPRLAPARVGGSECCLAESL